MVRRVGSKLPKSHAPAFRRALLVFLAFTYLFVGLAQTISCADDAIVSVMSSEFTNSLDDGSIQGDPKAVPVVAGHCHFCAPLMMPVLAMILQPSAITVALSYHLPIPHFEGHPRLDTPPPRHFA
jgi:hypothetical protein